jgi:hypothetical protein
LEKESTGSRLWFLLLVSGGCADRWCFGGGVETELGTELAEAAVRLDVGGCLLDLEDARLDRRLLQLR